MDSSTLLHNLARGFSAAIVASRALLPNPIESNPVVRAMFWVNVAVAWARGKRNEVLWLLSCVPRFRLPIGRQDADAIPLIQHIFRIIVHGRSDYKFGK